jgi:hypothetical protein
MHSMIESKNLSEAEYQKLRKRADELVGCTENSPEEKELKAICEALNAHEEQSDEEDLLLILASID